MAVSAGPSLTRPARATRHYRLDVQGLRGISVLAVVAYHAGLPLPGGFFAVDSFFVISGFVIAGLLLRDFEKTGGFSARTFYLRRARRLLPGAGLMIVCTVMLTAVLLSPLGVGQRAAGQAAMAASAFMANLYFMVTTGGYFQPAATNNPFLHMWSLSVEEQFYAVLPWVLLLGWIAFPRRRVRALVAVSVAAWLVSMAANLMFSYRMLPSIMPMHDLILADTGVRALAISFFSPITRSWEFLTGVILLLAARRYAPRHSIAPAMSWLGLSLLIGSFFLIDEWRPLPGLAALVPVTGTALVLLAGCSVPLRALTQRHLVGLGDVSYSWYLWHWPIILIAVTWFHSLVASLLAAAISLPIALLAYSLVEKPIRDQRRVRGDRAMALVALACVVVPIVAGYLLVRAWEHEWWSPQVQALTGQTRSAHLDETGGCSVATGISADQVCSFTVPDAQGTVLLTGDSSAGMYAEGMRAATAELGYNLDVAAHTACPLQIGLPSTAQSCASFVEQTLKGIADRRPPFSAVVVVNAGRYAYSSMSPGTMRAAVMQDRYEVFASAVGEVVEPIASVSPVLVIQPIPQATGGAFPGCLLPSVLVSPRWGCAAFDAAYLRTTVVPTKDALRRRLGSTATLYDPATTLCGEDDFCPMSHNGQLIYRDESHLTVDASIQLSDELEQALRATLVGQTSP